jgi:DNA-binding transcriptional ArsR family regulator
MSEGSVGHSDSAAVSTPAGKAYAQLEAEQGELTISQMSRLYDVTLRTLRFYEDRGLIKPRREGNARFYRTADRVRDSVLPTTVYRSARLLDQGQGDSGRE